jgi:ATP adenylyltransferase
MGNRFDHLYTPWRMRYLTGESGGKGMPDGHCVFCEKIEYVDEAKDAREYVVVRSQAVYVTLNRFPYNNGHVMIIPYQHAASVEELPAETLTDLMLTLNKTLAGLRKLYSPHGFNVGINLGGAAGAGIAGHVHMHCVPRWSGDTNYMTVVGGTRIIPDTLEDTWRKLREVWHTL